MKKLILAFGALFLALGSFPSAQAAGLPSSADVSFRVINISQDNQDAESVGVKRGDVLRYEVELVSETENVSEYVAQVDVSGIADHVEFVDLSLGQRDGDWIVYPAYTQSAPCKQVFTFFARFKGCDGGIGQLTAQSEGLQTLVPTSCDGPVTPTPTPKLPKSGPSHLWGLLLLVGLLGICLTLQRKVT